MPVNGGPADDRPIEEELWAAYLATEVTVDGRPAVEAGSGVGPCWVVTSHNPMSEPSTSDENDRHHDDLCSRLDADGLAWRPALGTSPDGTWSEASVAVTGIDRQAALALGRAFGQLAVFEVADGILRVHACFEDRTAERPL